MTAGLSGVKLVNAMKADGSQQQTIFIKQPQTDQQAHTVIGTVQQPQLLQHSNKVITIKNYKRYIKMKERERHLPDYCM